RAVAHAVEQRLHPDPIPEQYEALEPGVPQRNGEDPVEARRTLEPVGLVEVRDDLGVTPGAEAVSLGLELAPELEVIVDLPVEDALDLAALVRHRLLAGHQVDDGEPAHAKPHAGGRMDALAVRSPVDDRSGHALDQGPIGRGSLGRDAADAAHGYTSDDAGDDARARRRLRICMPT